MEKRILLQEVNKKIWTVSNIEEKKFLKKRVAPFPVDEYERKDIEHIIRHMRQMMIHERGVGLSANQIGLPFRIFVAQLPSPDGKGYVGKFYSFLNPELISHAKTKISDEEGCLSIPGMYGTVDRFEKIVVEGFDKQGRKVEVKAEGFLARIFQHEIDHLDGKLFIDKARNIFSVAREDATHFHA